jgi:signal transduction histidine kinase
MSGFPESPPLNALPAVHVDAQWLADLAWQLLFVDGDIAHYRVRGIDPFASWRAMRPIASAAENATRCLEREFSLAARLDSRWALQPLALLADEAGPVLILSDFGGDSLHDTVPGGLTVERFLALAIGATTALQRVHGAGLLHRDIKPCNLVEGADGIIRLSGFGLALEARAGEAQALSDSICGTLAYMSPEQARRVERRADARSDLYSLGMTFYEWLAGQLPFEATDAVGWVYCHVARQPPPLTVFRGDLPSALSQLVLKLIAKNPAERFQSAESLGAELCDCLSQWRHLQGMAAAESLGCDSLATPALSSSNIYSSHTAPPSSRASIIIAGGQDSLDLASVMKAAQALSEETQLDRLIEILLRNTMVHAGAQRGLLLLVKDEAPMICAAGQSGDHGITIELTEQVPDKRHLPLSVLYRVMRTRQRLVFDDVSLHPYFSADEYLVTRNVYSVLCLPLIKQGQVIGALYLENNLVPGVFTSSRTSVLELLASQAAISLESSRLHLQLVEENNRRRDTESALHSARAELARVSQATIMGELAASIAHEINQPLASMVSNAAASLRWLNRPEPNIAEALSGLRDIVTDGRRAGEIVSALQSLARQTPQNRRRLQINEVIRRVAALTSNELEQHRVLMTTHLTRSPLRVMASCVQLQQVILNLILNALDAMSGGDHVLRRLSISSEVVGHDYMVVSVEDSGVGIALEDMDKVFNAFFTTKDKGMGMGLAICRSIIDAHGGQLQVMPARFGGTTFVFTLPVDEPEAL